MFIRIFLPLVIIGTALQAHSNGPIEGYACQDDTAVAGFIKTRGGRFNGCGDEWRRGGKFGHFRRASQHTGGHGGWNIPAQEGRRLNPIEVSPQSLELGKTLYRDNCLLCHGDQGIGDGPQSQNLRVAPANLHHAARHYSDGDLFYIIRKGRDPMPAWEGKLSENEMWNLINYLRFDISAHRKPLYSSVSRFSYCQDKNRSDSNEADKNAEADKQMSNETQTHQVMDHEKLPDEHSNE